MGQIGFACCKSGDLTNRGGITVEVPNANEGELPVIFIENKDEDEETKEFKKMKQTNSIKFKSKGSIEMERVNPVRKKTGKTTSFKLLSEDKDRLVGKRRTTKALFRINESSTEAGATLEEVEPIIEEELSEEQMEMIKIILEQLELCEGLDEETIEELILAFFRLKVEEKVLYNAGDFAGMFYIIDEGSVEFFSDQANETLKLFAGDYFGLESLVENQYRFDTAKVLEPTTLLCLPGEHYRNAFEYMKLKILDEKKSILKQIPILKNLDQMKLIQLCKVMEERSYNQGSIIISEEEHFDRIYFIIEGTVTLSRNLKRTKRISANNYFGDIHVFVRKQSYFTYSTESPVFMFELKYKSIKEALGENYHKFILNTFFISCISKSERINEYLCENINDLYNSFTLKYYTTDEVVYLSNSQKNKKICIVLSGRLKKQNKSEIVAISEDLFGESIIETKVNLDANLVSEDITLTLEAEWNDILKAFKLGSRNNVASLYDTVNRMKKISLFSTLSEIKLFQFAKKMQIEVFNPGDEIIQEGSDGDKFYIIKSGKVKAFQKGKFLREMEQGSCFGEISILTGMIKTVTVYASEKNTECFVLAKDSFNEVSDQALLKHLQKIFALQDVSVTLDSLFYIKTLGNGRFGKVILVHNSKSLYAVKYAHVKTICRKENLMKYYLNEKNLMMKIDHPFIIKLVKTMKAQDFLFFLLEYIDGITLKTYIERRKKNNLKNIYETGFYGAILLCVINYLHKKRILHRDIKPDNCMIDKNGYLKVIDFGIAKQLNEKDYTSTVCGTPHYIAPEVILGKGYSFSADYWSIGISMFEIFYGYVPFGTSSNNVMDIYNEIVNRNLVLPYDPRYNEINNFFKIILSKNLIQRVCNFNLVRSHPFFHQTDFDLLTDFAIKPPFIPETIDITSGGTNYLSRIGTSLNNFLENNAIYQEEFNDFDEIYEKEKKLVDEF